MDCLKNFKNGFLLLILSFVLLSYFVSTIFRYPMTGIEVKRLNSLYYIIYIYENTWAAKNGIQVGDIVRKVNNKEPEENIRLKTFSRIEQIKTIDIVHGNNQIKYQVSYKKGDQQIIYHLIFPTIFTLILLSMSMLLIHSNLKKKKQSTLYLIRFLITLSFTYISVIVYGRMDLLGLLLKSITFTFIFPLFISFMQVYYKDRSTVFTSEFCIASLYIFASISSCAAILFRFLNCSTAKLNSLSFVFLLIITFTLLIRFYYKHKYSVDVSIILLIIISASISLMPFIFLFIIPNLILDKELITFELSAVFFIFVPVYSLSMLISKSLFDFESIINRLQYYLFISFGISEVLFIISFIIFEKRVESLLEVIQFNTLAFIIICIALYLKDYLDFTFRKVLYDHKKNYTNSLNRFMHQTKREYKIKKIIKFIKREVEDVLRVTNPICISVNNMSGKIRFFEKEDIISLAELYKINWNRYGIGSILYIEDYSVIITAILPDYRVVLLAKRKKFNIDEIVWLETLANYANLQFECLRKIERFAKNLEHVNFDTNYPAEYARVSFMIAEKERENLARDIHDGVLQDQLRLYRRIEVREKEESNEEFKKVLRQIGEQIMDHIYITRETCNNLRPPFLEELGLEKTLLSLIKKVNREANFLLYYEIQKELHITDIEISHCIYRVTQELLNNAIKHSQASQVKLRLFEQDNYLRLHYFDDGIGMEKQPGKSLKSTMGISGIIARVKGLHGSVSIDSNQGSGVCIQIKFKKDYLYK